MAGRDPDHWLDADQVQRILAPITDTPSDLAIRVEDASGVLVALTGTFAGASDARFSRELRVEDALIGRMVAEGGAIADPAVLAMVEALALGLEALAVARRASGATDDPHASADRTSSLAADLAMSRLQQRTIVSLQAPHVEGYDLASHYEPAREIGGDFFELFRIRRRAHPLGVVIADVAGKGIAAALLMAFARPVIHTALTAASGPSEALERTNRILVDELHTTLFITVLAARLDIRTGSFRMANAGHEPPLLIPGDDEAIAPVNGGGPLMGAFSRLGIPEVEIELCPGDTLLLYTDGVTDARSEAGERFGKARLLEGLERVRGGTAHEVVARIRDDVAAFRGAADPVDDVTIVAIGRHGP
jgi:serine phosphatase RsbU (regulator of sigma subunit)